MKVLSVRQPWAWALIHGGKDVENRNWPTSYRGQLAIHAGKQFDFTKAEWRDCSAGSYGRGLQMMARRYNEQDTPILGAIIGIVEVYDCIPDNHCDSKWKACGEGFFCWLVRNPRALREPILLKGQLGLFDVPDAFFRGDVPCDG